MMEPRIEILKETKLVGFKVRMSFSNNKTVALWKRFSPRKNEVKNPVSAHLYSVEIYNDENIFTEFNPRKEFVKWAAREVEDFDDIPAEMEKLVIPQGLYAVFHYVGKPSEALKVFQYIYGKWLPDSGYALDNRPHLALMGNRYKGEDPASEEEFWIPLRKRQIID